VRRREIFVCDIGGPLGQTCNAHTVIGRKEEILGVEGPPRVPLGVAVLP
jgi:hypothetical protein